ncbi:6-phosphogluconolactonase [hydrothermal vent metagenome]|uniref:6-phosphogluconolactonase n=1 Tax=hydrothermal vent metagenome TaxID=652676 RepID=A0A3B1AFR8_9ZZZZ
MKKAARISGKCFRNLRGIAIAAALALVALPSFAAPFAYVTEAFSGSIRVIDTTTNTEISTLSTNANGGDTVVHPSGKFVYVSSGFSSNSRLDVYDTADNSLIAAIPMPGRPAGIAIHPSGDYIYSVHSGAGTGTVLVIDTSTNTVSATVEVAHRISKIAIHPSGNTLYVGKGVSGAITAIDTNTLQAIDVFYLRYAVNDLEMHPSGQYLYASTGRSLLVIDTGTNSIVDSIELRGAYNIAVSSDGSSVYVSGDDMTNSVIFAVDVSANTHTLSGSTVLPGLFYFGLAVHPGGGFVYAVGHMLGSSYPEGPEGVVWVIDTASNQITDTINVAASEGSLRGLPTSITIGPLLEPVGGVATGISAISVTCTNSTSGQSVSIGFGNEKTWDCESSGLQVNTGDSIEMVVTGNAN